MPPVPTFPFSALLLVLWGGDFPVKCAGVSRIRRVLTTRASLLVPAPRESVRNFAWYHGDFRVRVVAQSLVLLLRASVYSQSLFVKLLPVSFKDQTLLFFLR